MEKLYEIMEQLLEAEYKIQCLTTLLSQPYDKLDSFGKEELTAVLGVAADSAQAAANVQRSAISMLDSYITENARKHW